MAYCTLYFVSSGVPVPGHHCRTFLKFTEEKVTLLGPRGEERTAGKHVKTIKDLNSGNKHTFTCFFLYWLNIAL